MDNNELTKELLLSIQATMKFTQELLDGIRDDSYDRIGLIESRLQSITDMQILLRDIKDDSCSTSLITRITILEHTFDELKSTMEEIRDEVAVLDSRINSDVRDEAKIRKEKNVYLIKLMAASLPGVLSLIMLVIKLFAG